MTQQPEDDQDGETAPWPNAPRQPFWGDYERSALPPPPAGPPMGPEPAEGPEHPPSWQPAASAGEPVEDLTSRPPTPPDAPDHRKRASRRPRMLSLVVTALASALLGAAIGSGAMIIALDIRSQVPQPDPPAAVVTAIAPAPSPSPSPSDAEDEPGLDRVAVIAAAVLPTVVQVDIGAGDQAALISGNGSGVIYRSDGYIITNNHVVAGGDGLEAVLADGSREPAEIVGTDPVTDLAVIKIDRDDLDAIDIGDSSQLQVGELAVAVGSPFGLEGSVTAGIISAINRPIEIRGGPEGALVLPNVIQTDAPINPGNSGGALVGGDGRLIGINSAILSTTDTPANAGVGFAIPVNTVIDIVDELIADGVVHHPFLGVRGQNMDQSTTESTGVERGAYVVEVLDGTPAAEAGLTGGDVVVAVGSQDIGSMDQLTIVIRGHDVGETVRITYVRDGVEHTVQIVLGELPR